MSFDVARLNGIDGLDVAGKRVLVRADLNVPMANGHISDATRIERVLPTIRELAQRGAKVIVLSHFGRPKGKRSPELSLKPVAEKIDEMLGHGVHASFVGDCIGAEAEKTIAALEPGQVTVLENLRFYGEEEKNDEPFAKSLSALGDLYVNDAFSCAHRAHASTEGIAHHIPSYAGRSLMAEIQALAMAVDNPKRPVAAVVGGAKVSTKIPILINLAAKVNTLIIGGGMANTFLHAQGVDVGKSLCEPDFASTVKDIMNSADKYGCHIALPIDAVVARELKAGAASSICDVNEAPNDSMILDVGPKTVEDLMIRVEASKTLLWNGPLGAFEIQPFGEGTFALAKKAAELTKAGDLVTIAGGGDTVAALNAAGVTDDFTYVSTAGGAFLEYLEGRELPGLAVLARR